MNEICKGCTTSHPDLESPIAAVSVRKIFDELAAAFCSFFHFAPENLSGDEVSICCI